VTVTGSNGISATYNVSFTVTQANQAPTITSNDYKIMLVGTSGTFQVTATGYPSTMTYSLSGQPSGVSINASTGVMSIPSSLDIGVYTFTVIASNGISPDAAQNFTLEVQPPPAHVSSLTLTAPTYTYTIGDPPIQLTALVTGTNLTHGTGNEAVNWAAGNTVLPYDGGYITQDGLFTADVPGVWRVTVNAMDDPSRSADVLITVVVPSNTKVWTSNATDGYMVGAASGTWSNSTSNINDVYTVPIPNYASNLTMTVTASVQDAPGTGVVGIQVFDNSSGALIGSSVGETGFPDNTSGGARQQVYSVTVTGLPGILSNQTDKTVRIVFTHDSGLTIGNITSIRWSW